MIYKYLITSMLCIFLFNTDLFSGGCCGSGSPIASMGTPSITSGSLLFKTGYNYNQSQSEDLTRHTISLLTAYGITNHLSFNISARYAIVDASQKRNGLYDTSNGLIDTIKADTTLTFNNSGFGDGSFGIQYIVLPFNLFTKQELKAGIEVVLPWGSTNHVATIDGMQTSLPQKAQIGSGAYSINTLLSYSKSFPSIYTSLTSQLVSSFYFKNQFDEKAGNAFNVSISASEGPFWKTNLHMSLGYSIIQPTIDSLSKSIAGTKGQRLTMSPGAEYKFSDNFTASLNCSFLLWKEETLQLYDEKFGLSFQIVYIIPLHSK